MILNGHELGAGIPTWLSDVGKTALTSAGVAAAGSIGNKLRSSQTPSTTPTGQSSGDNTIRNVALAGGAIVLGVVLIGKVLGRRRATNPGRRRRRHRSRRR